MEQREVGRLGEWRAGGGHLDLAALPAAAAALPHGVLSLGHYILPRVNYSHGSWLVLHAPRTVSELVASTRACRP